MENAADALKMAGSVLLFVIALSVAIISITEVRESTDKVLAYSDRETLSIEGDSRFYYLAGNPNDTSRYVGKETIIPSIYRAYKENFKIIFEFNTDYYLFEKQVKDLNSTTMKKINHIDLAKQGIATDADSREFLDGIIYHKYKDSQAKFEAKFGIKVTNTIGLYDYIESANKKIKESLGTYYIEDLSTDKNEGTIIQKSEVSDVNKTEKRVITYTFQ